MMRVVRTSLAALGCVALGGCLAMRAYDGPRQRVADVAIVQGDFKIRAASPLSLLLRRVDDRPVDVRFSAVEVLPGEHTLLVDCILDGAVASRHPLTVTLAAGGRYRLEADTGPGLRECATVRLVAGNSL